MNDNVEKLKKQAMEIYVYTDYYGDKDCVLRLNEEKFAELIVNKHLSIWEQMDNGNAVAGYVEMEDYPKAILKYFGIEE